MTDARFIERPTADPEQLKLFAHIVYLLYALALPSLGVIGVVAVILAHLKRDQAAGTIYQSHFTWQIRTFWVGLVLGIISVILWVVMLRWLAVALVGLWLFWRVAKGWVLLFGRHPITSPDGFL